MATMFKVTFKLGKKSGHFLVLAENKDKAIEATVDQIGDVSIISVKVVEQLNKEETN